MAELCGLRPLGRLPGLRRRPGSPFGSRAAVPSFSLRLGVWPCGFAWKISSGPNPRLHLASALLLLSCRIRARSFLPLSTSKPRPFSHMRMRSTTQDVARIYSPSFLGQLRPPPFGSVSDDPVSFPPLGTDLTTTRWAFDLITLTVRALSPSGGRQCYSDVTCSKQGQ